MLLRAAPLMVGLAPALRSSSDYKPRPVLGTSCFLTLTAQASFVDRSQLSSLGSKVRSRTSPKRETVP